MTFYESLRNLDRLESKVSKSDEYVGKVIEYLYENAVFDNVRNFPDKLKWKEKKTIEMYYSSDNKYWIDITQEELSKILNIPSTGVNNAMYLLTSTPTGGGYNECFVIKVKNGSYLVNKDFLDKEWE